MQNYFKTNKRREKRLNTFIKDTTHELNTPISAILMSTESTNLTPKQIERVKLCKKEYLKFIKDLTYVFLENHLNEKIINELSLNTIINEQLKYFEALASKKELLLPQI